MLFVSQDGEYESRGQVIVVYMHEIFDVEHKAAAANDFLPG